MICPSILFPEQAVAGSERAADLSGRVSRAADYSRSGQWRRVVHRNQFETPRRTPPRVGSVPGAMLTKT